MFFDFSSYRLLTFFNYFSEAVSFHLPKDDWKENHTRLHCWGGVCSQISLGSLLACLHTVPHTENLRGDVCMLLLIIISLQIIIHGLKPPVSQLVMGHTGQERKWLLFALTLFIHCNNNNNNLYSCPEIIIV